MSIAEKLTAIAENEQRVYDAGKEKIVSLHPEKTVSGSYISANDVSELPHGVKCKVTGVDNPESVTVTRCGKNLLNPHNWSHSEILKYNGVDCVRLQDSKDYSVFNGVFKENTRYTFTFKAYREAEDVDKLMVMLFEYTDGTYDGTHRAESSEILTITSAEGKTVSKIKSGWNHSKEFYLDLSVSCLHEGTTSTDFEPYNGQTLTPSADGTVEGLTSTYPQMNIFTDNADAMLDVTYRISAGKEAQTKAFWDEYLIKPETGNMTDNFSFAFAGYCWNEKILRTIPYRLKIGNAVSMFQYNKQVQDLSWFPLEDGRIYNWRTAFADATNLHTLWELDFSKNIVELTNAFTNCTSLANVTVVPETIDRTIDFQWCPLTKKSITSIVYGLRSDVTGQTCTFKKSAKEAAFTEDEWAALIATKSNWTISLI